MELDVRRNRERRRLDIRIDGIGAVQRRKEN